MRFAFNRTLFGTLLATFLLLSIIPAGLIGFISFKVSEKLLNANISKSNIETLNQIDKNIGVLADQVIAIVSMYNSNNELPSLLTQTYSNPNDEVLDKTKVEDMMMKYSFAFDWLNFQTFLVGENGLVYSQINGNGINDVERLRTFLPSFSVIQDPDHVTWLHTHPSFIIRTVEQPVFTACKTTTNGGNKKKLWRYPYKYKGIRHLSDI